MRGSKYRRLVGTLDGDVGREERDVDATKTETNARVFEFARRSRRGNEHGEADHDRQHSEPDRRVPPRPRAPDRASCRASRRRPSPRRTPARAATTTSSEGDNRSDSEPQAGEPSRPGRGRLGLLPKQTNWTPTAPTISAGTRINWSRTNGATMPTATAATMIPPGRARRARAPSRRSSSPTVRYATGSCITIAE